MLHIFIKWENKHPKKKEKTEPNLVKKKVADAGRICIRSGRGSRSRRSRSS